MRPRRSHCSPLRSPATWTATSIRTTLWYCMAIALAALARAYIALAAVIGEPYVINGEPRNGAVL